MNNAPLKTLLDFYISRQDELVKTYRGRILLIHDNTVIGDFSTKTDAFYAGMDRFEPGSFMIIKCEPGETEYTVNYRTVARFSRMATA